VCSRLWSGPSAARVSCRFSCLRELDELSYNEISDVIGAPFRTLMSGCRAHARRLRTRLGALIEKEEERCS